MLDLCIFLSWFRQNMFFHWSSNIMVEVSFEVKNVLMVDFFFLQTCNFSLHKTWTYELLWCYHQLFGLSFWRHPLIHYRGSISEQEMLCSISRNLLRCRKQTHLCLRHPEGEYVVWVNYSFNLILYMQICYWSYFMIECTTKNTFSFRFELQNCFYIKPRA